MMIANDEYLDSSDAYKIIYKIAQVWGKEHQVLTWLKDLALSGHNRYSQFYSVGAMACHWENHPEILPWLINHGLNSDDCWVQVASLREIVGRYHEQRNVFPILKEIAQSNNNPSLQQEAIKLLASGWKEYDDTLDLLKTCAESEAVHFGVRSEAITELANGWTHETWVFNFLCERLILDPFVREHTSNRNPRLRAIEALLEHYPTHTKTLEILNDRALNDPDDQLRQWAQDQLQKLEVNP